jgi:arylsulfatase A-like enzyme
MCANRVRWLLAAMVGIGAAGEASGRERPNVVLIYADDLGYGDLGCFGATGYATPNLDRIAAEGVKFTDFYSAQAVCSASRTALLTGCYPNRVGILGALGPGAKIGIAAEETTLGEVMRSAGYATAAVGKWHLGDGPKFLPTRHGFDSYFGLPYSNDMWPKHPSNPKGYPPLPLIDGEEVVEEMPDQRTLTRRYTERAVSFIESSKDRPFFVYLAHSMPHVPLFVSEGREGKAERGLFGDVIEEIDWSAGQILETLERLGLDEKTLVIFTSDNGPWLSYGDHAGSAGPFREGKGTSFEGGVREPFVARWPGKIPAGSVVSEPAMTIDVLPTLAALVGAEPPALPIDGRDITPLLLAEEGATNPREASFFWWGRELQAVRSGRWKLHFPHEYRALKQAGSGGKPGPYEQRAIGLSLFDLGADPSETRDVKAEHPGEVARLQALAEEAREELGDALSGRKGRGEREPGSL